MARSVFVFPLFVIPEQLVARIQFPSAFVASLLRVPFWHSGDAP